MLLTRTELLLPENMHIGFSQAPEAQKLPGAYVVMHPYGLCAYLRLSPIWSETLLFKP